MKRTKRRMIKMKQALLWLLVVSVALTACKPAEQPPAPSTSGDIPLEGSVYGVIESSQDAAALQDDLDDSTVNGVEKDLNELDW